MSAVGDIEQLERDHLDRKSRAQDAVAPHAELQSIERRLRVAAAEYPNPERQRALLRAADHAAKAAGELVTLAELLAPPPPGGHAR